VADGHGHSSCFRSETGAELAVACALEVLGEYRKGHEEAIPRVLSQRWRRAVRAHAGDETRPWAAYGSTILGILATEEFVLYLQLGDGDILIVSKDGEVVRPWPRDERLLGVETTSLSLQNAAGEMRVELRGEIPQLILLCTDGYANSFREDSGFLQVGRDILGIIRDEGREKFEGNLSGWLSEASELGSGDDITLGYLCHE
jgi:hypothetical protein